MNKEKFIKITTKLLYDLENELDGEPMYEIIGMLEIMKLEFYLKGINSKRLLKKMRDDLINS